MLRWCLGQPSRQELQLPAVRQHHQSVMVIQADTHNAQNPADQHEPTAGKHRTESIGNRGEVRRGEQNFGYSLPTYLACVERGLRVTRTWREGRTPMRPGHSQQSAGTRGLFPRGLLGSFSGLVTSTASRSGELLPAQPARLLPADCSLRSFGAQRLRSSRCSARSRMRFSI